MLNDKIGKYLASQLNLSNDQSQIISYGIFACSYIVLSLSIISLIGVFCGFIVEALVFSFTASLLRQFSGGAHANKLLVCLLIGTTTTIFYSFLVSSFYHLIPFNLVIILFNAIFILSFYIIYKRAPIEAKNKPIDSKSKKLKLKRYSLYLLSFYELIALILISTYFNTRNPTNTKILLSMIGAIIWQTFNLTTFGINLLQRINNISK